MTPLDDKKRHDIAELAIQETKFLFRWAIWLPLVATLGSAAAAYTSGLGWTIIAEIAAGVATLGLFGLGLYIYFYLPSLKKWAELTATTDLTGFEKINRDSVFMPIKVLERRNINILQVLGNGCSKWTMRVGEATAIDSFKRIRQGGGRVQFLASCPIHLSKEADESKRIKAKRNATSLLKLREFAEKSRGAGGTFVIKTYEHVATLRLIILNETDCIVGHYQEDGNGDSLDTPLLLFHHNHEYKWGFGGAFKRMFESEWHRAKEPTLEDWEKMKAIRDKPE